MADADGDAKAIRLVGQFLRRAVKDGNDLEARDGMALAATLGGLAFSNAGVALVHAMEYPVGGAVHVSHGAGNGLLLPFVMRFNRAGRESRVRCHRLPTRHPRLLGEPAARRHRRRRATPQGHRHSDAAARHRGDRGDAAGVRGQGVRHQAADARQPADAAERGRDPGDLPRRVVNRTASVSDASQKRRHAPPCATFPHARGAVPPSQPRTRRYRGHRGGCGACHCAGPDAVRPLRLHRVLVVSNALCPGSEPIRCPTAASSRIRGGLSPGLRNHDVQPAVGAAAARAACGVADPPGVRRLACHAVTRWCSSPRAGCGKHSGETRNEGGLPPRWLWRSPRHSFC